MKKSFLLLSMLSISGCTTIHFDNGPQNPTDKTMSIEQWHHNFAGGIYEGSKPVNLEKSCEGKTWNSVQTQLSVMNNIASGLVNVVGPIWYPKTVTIACKNITEKK